MLLMALMEKKRYGERRLRRQTIRKRRWRTGLLVFIGLVVLALAALILFGLGITSQTDEAGVVERVEDPTVSGAPEAVSEESSTEEEATDEAEAADEVEAIVGEDIGEDRSTPTTTPPNSAMTLSVPKLGISGAIVAGGEAGLELGVQHLDGTGFPWQPGSNTYLAGHRVGFPGTGSDRIFYSLPAMSAGDEITLQDSIGQVYTYRVSNVFAVTPYDLWVTAPTGKDMVTLQVCTETPDDWWTIGPSLMSSGPESGRLIVQGERVA